MKKASLLSLIGKYTLGGTNSSVKWVSTDDSTLLIDFMAADKSVLGSLVVTGIKLPEGQYGIYDTEGLVKLLTALDQDVEISVGGTNRSKTITNIDFSDGSSTARFHLADLAIIPEPSKLQQQPGNDVVLTLDREMMDRFIKSVTATGATLFAIFGDTTALTFIINYSTLPTNRIEFNMVGEVNQEIVEPVCFNALIVKEILSANKDATTSFMKISTQVPTANGSMGRLLTLNFEGDDFTSTYFTTHLEIPN